MKKLLTIGLIVGIGVILNSLNANSVFSFDGFPTQNYTVDAYGLGMGETGISDTFRRNTGLINPSLATTLNYVYFSTGVSTGLYKYSDKNNTSGNNGVDFPYFNIVLPISKHRLGFNFSPQLAANADLYSKDVKWESGDFTYTDIKKVRSYIYTGSLLYAYKNDFVNVGLSLSYYLGHRFQHWSQEFQGIDNFTNATYEINDTYRTPGFGIGLNRSWERFSLGATYRSAVTLEGKKEMVAVHQVEDLGDSKLSLPHQMGLGLTYKLNETLKVSSDVYYDMEEKDTTDTRDSYKVGLGLSYDPLWGYEKWYQSVPLRIGAYYRTLPFEVNNNSLDEYAVTFGFSLPIKTPNSQIDFAFKYSVRGDVERHGMSDNNYVLTIGYSGFDIFRNRPKKTAERQIPEAEFESFR